MLIPDDGGGPRTTVWTNDIGLITRRSQVQILPPPPSSSKYTDAFRRSSASARTARPLRCAKARGCEVEGAHRLGSLVTAWGPCELARGEVRPAATPRVEEHLRRRLPLAAMLRFF